MGNSKYKVRSIKNHVKQIKNKRKMILWEFHFVYPKRKFILFYRKVFRLRVFCVND